MSGAEIIPLREKVTREQVAAWLVNDALDEVYIFHRTPERGGFWQPITGGRKPSDASYEAAASREIFEETGLVVSETDLVTGGFIFSFRNERGLHTERTFATRISDETASTIHLSNEHDDLRLVRLDDVAEYMSFEENIEALHITFEALKQHA